MPIPKKSNATRCKEYRTMSIMSQVKQLLVTIVMKRDKIWFLESKTDMRMTFGCPKRCTGMYICFLDYEKAFHRVRHEPHAYNA